MLSIPNKFVWWWKTEMSIRVYIREKSKSSLLLLSLGNHLRVSCKSGFLWILAPRVCSHSLTMLWSLTFYDTFKDKLVDWVISQLLWAKTDHCVLWLLSHPIHPVILYFAVSLCFRGGCFIHSHHEDAATQHNDVWRETACGDGGKSQSVQWRWSHSGKNGSWCALETFF